MSEKEPLLPEPVEAPDPPTQPSEPPDPTEPQTHTLGEGFAAEIIPQDIEVPAVEESSDADD